MPAAGFTLASIESQEGLLLPVSVIESQSLAWLAQWDYPGNPYRGSRSLRLRALTLAAVDMIMLDHLYDHNPRGAARADYLGGNLIWIGYTYLHCREALSAPARQAFEAGIRRLVEQRLVKWGPKGLMTDMDLFAPVGLRYLSEALGDPAFSAVCREYSRQLFTDEKYFHPAGYFVDNGCFDTSYNGISLYFGVWAALLAPDWDFAQAALRQALRLRAHLCFPAPDGSFSGPSGMSSRTSADPARDQWQFANRLPAEGMLADEALYRAPLPELAEMQKVHPKLLAGINKQLAAPAPGKPGPWLEVHWSHRLNYAYELCPAGHYERLVSLAATRPELFKPLYAGDERFIREFERAFVIARLDGWAAAVHTGPVGRPVGHNGLWYGFGGGQLAAFWTPAAGVLIANRSRGVQGQIFNTYDEWRNWPAHAVSGLTADDGLVSSNRIQLPATTQAVGQDQAAITVGGEMPLYNPKRTGVRPSGLHYERQFSLASGAVTITTTVRGGDNPPLVAELYESIPVFLSETNNHPPTAIEFHTGAGWQPGTPEAQAGVDAVRLSRFNGAALISFAKPQRLRLGPAVWTDGYQTKAAMRTLPPALNSWMTAAVTPANRCASGRPCYPTPSPRLTRLPETGDLLCGEFWKQP